MVLQTFLNQRHQRMRFDVTGKGETLRIGIPCALQ